MYISTIKWPQSEADKIKLYLGFMIKVLDTLNIDFPCELKNPLQHAKAYFNGAITKEDYEKDAELCWKYIDERDGIREFKDKEILKARLGISLLSATKDTEKTGEKLSWFFELLEFLGIDLDYPARVMRQHFEFERP